MSDENEVPGGWELQNSPLTVEGEIEGFARFATGARRSKRRAVKLAALVIVAAFVLPLLIGFVTLVWRLFAS